ncbi:MULTISPECIES: hypothetical protein [Pseudoalteromonas]|uniref:Uncharacterized protein n=1 Tax=Pseudoalteromonas rubra TaxID=43658 RepID=A0A5S3UTY2_9GAMM|nr:MULTISPECIES: hypothetical protein [Pseudoalteromonas]MCG7560327.1 hypothetical protein [Pseudoalteromonas sp. McH1-42]MEC4088733.1 hypothetical protein [Pseudoalteromonas rubra]QPB85492.1 hypothetical protein CWC22_021000 [Pseudoalteromonas rubra]
MTRAEKLLYRLILADLLSCHPAPLPVSALRLQGIKTDNVTLQAVIDLMTEQQVISVSPSGEIRLAPRSDLNTPTEGYYPFDLANID